MSLRRCSRCRRALNPIRVVAASQHDFFMWDHGHERWSADTFTTRRLEPILEIKCSRCGTVQLRLSRRYILRCAHQGPVWTTWLIYPTKTALMEALL